MTDSMTSASRSGLPAVQRKILAWSCSNRPSPTTQKIRIEKGMNTTSCSNRNSPILSGFSRHSPSISTCERLRFKDRCRICAGEKTMTLISLKVQKEVWKKFQAASLAAGMNGSANLRRLMVRFLRSEARKALSQRNLRSLNIKTVRGGTALLRQKAIVSSS